MVDVNRKGKNKEQTPVSCKFSVLMLLQLIRAYTYTSVLYMYTVRKLSTKQDLRQNKQWFINWQKNKTLTPQQD